MKALAIPLVAALVMSSTPGCNKPEKHTHRFENIDGGPPPDREECKVQTLDCFNKCVKRDASAVCIGCCRDQDALCRMQQKYSFEYCDTAQ
jgi:hypothetical protein